MSDERRSGWDPPAGDVEVEPTAETLREVTDRLRRAGAALRRRRAADIARALGAAGARFLDPRDAIRTEALARLPASTGLSAPVAEAVLDAMAADWSADRLGALLEEELGDPAVLDRFVRRGRRECMATGPGLCVQIVAGGVPGVGVGASIRSLLVKSPTLLKPGRGDVVLPTLFARALGDVDEEVARALAVTYWDGGAHPSAERAAVAAADVLVVYGSDATVRDLRAAAPPTTRVVGYHHRISVGVVGREALAPDAIEGAAAQVATAIAAYDQRGCVSPRLIFVEEGGTLGPDDFAERLATALGALETTLPAGPVDAGAAAALRQARDTAELMAAEGRATVAHGGAAAWTVVGEGASGDGPDGPGRFVRVRPLGRVEDLPAALTGWRRHLQTIGYVGMGDRLTEVATRMAAAGAIRMAPFDGVAYPPPWWHHDGGGPLTDLVRWVDLERAEAR